MALKEKGFGKIKFIVDFTYYPEEKRLGFREMGVEIFVAGKDLTDSISDITMRKNKTLVIKGKAEETNVLLNMTEEEFQGTIELKGYISVKETDNEVVVNISPE